LNAISKLVVPLIRKPQTTPSGYHKELPLRRVSADSNLRYEGLVIFANDKAFGCSLSHLIESGWEAVRLKELVPILKKLFDDDARMRGTRVGQPFRIQQYRVNTLYGDFVFDIEPVEGESTRHFTILSHYNLARQVAMLYSETGLFYIFPDKLAQDISPVFADYLDLPSPATKKEKQ
jgi:hypothetical protein